MNIIRVFVLLSVSFLSGISFVKAEDKQKNPDTLLKAVSGMADRENYLASIPDEYKKHIETMEFCHYWEGQQPTDQEGIDRKNTKMAELGCTTLPANETAVMAKMTDPQLTGIMNKCHFILEQGL